MDSLRLVDRQTATRWVAPAVFLLAVTAAVLVVRSSLGGSDAPVARETPAVVRKTAPVRAAPAPVASVPKQYYVIESGDTLDQIALHFGTSVDILLSLNPGVEPTALRPGARLRVK